MQGNNARQDSTMQDSPVKHKLMQDNAKAICEVEKDKGSYLPRSEQDGMNSALSCVLETRDYKEKQGEEELQAVLEE